MAFGVTNCPGLPEPEEFPRMWDFRLKLGQSQANRNG